MQPRVVLAVAAAAAHVVAIVDIVAVLEIAVIVVEKYLNDGMAMMRRRMYAKNSSLEMPP
jgi:hypothetical protein